MVEHEIPADGAVLLRRLRAAGGELTVPDPSRRDRAAVRRAIWQIRSRGPIPGGLELTYTGRDRGDMVVRLRRPDDRRQRSEPREPSQPHVSVPKRLAKPHPAVVATRAALQGAAPDDHGRLRILRGRDTFDVRVSRPQIGRALRLLQGLVRAVEDSGYEIQPSEFAHGHVRLSRAGHSYPLRLVEILERTRHEPTASELEHQRRHSWARIPDYDYHPSGRLRVELAPWQGRRYRWSDTTRWGLEGRLADVLHELDSRTRLDEEREREVQRQREEQWRQHQRRLDVARRRMATEARADELASQVAAWRRASTIRDYCAALEVRAGGLEDAAADTGAWIDWARRYADDIDPTLAEPLPTAPVTPAASDGDAEDWLRAHGRA